MVFKGLETVRSDWTSLARRFQQELYRRVFADEPVETFVRDTLAALMAGRHDQELVYRKRLRQPLEAYLRNVPPHAQAARRAVAGGASAEFYGQGRAVEYVITLAGPEVVQQISQPLDYEHYAQRQLAPVADGILFFFGTSFRDIVDGQIALF
jgi:DNA polymerase-2